MALFAPIKRYIRKAYLALDVSADTLETCAFMVGNQRECVTVDYHGPNDGTLIPALRGACAGSILNAPPVGGFSQWRAFRAEDIAAALTYLAPAMCVDDSRQALCGVRCEPGTLVATDGHRMHWLENAPSIFGDASYTIPAWAVETLRRAIAWVRPANVAFTANGAHAVIKVESPSKAVWVSCKLGEQFPQWRQALPNTAENHAHLYVKAEAFLDALKQAPKAVVQPANVKRFDLLLAPSIVDNDPTIAPLAARHTSGELYRLPALGQVASAHRLCVGCDLLTDAVGAMSGPVSVWVETVSNDVLGPVLLDNGNRKAVVMPMRG